MYCLHLQWRVYDIKPAHEYPITSSHYTLEYGLLYSIPQRKQTTVTIIAIVRN